MRAGTLAILLVQVSCQILKQAGWLIRTALLNAMLLKQTFPLGILVLLMVGLGDRLRMLLVICRMALYTESTNYNAGSWIFLICADLRFRHQAVWREAHGQNPCSCLKKSVAYHNWFALPERPVGF